MKNMTSTIEKEVEIDDNVLLKVKDLSVCFPVRGGIFLRKKAEIRAVDKVSFEIKKGETLGLVGESGSGKSTLGKSIMNVLEITAPGVDIAGNIVMNDDDNGFDLLNIKKNELFKHRRDIQMVFQDPYSSLNPRMLIKDIVQEPMNIHLSSLSKKERSDMADSLLEKVGLSVEQGNRYPHEFSGGQKQRIGIARSLATNPKLIIADEPVSALDVSIQAQVINLLNSLKKEYGLTLLFIAHDLSVVKHLSDRIAVMYLGDIVEIGDADEIYSNPKHPYTQSLISSIPQLDPTKRNRERIKLKGEIPSPLAKPSGCGFHKRCHKATSECSLCKPVMKDIGDGHKVACINI